jgi:hypothetical protein
MDLDSELGRFLGGFGHIVLGIGADMLMIYLGFDQSLSIQSALLFV